MSTYILPDKSSFEQYMDGAWQGDLNLGVNPVTGNPALLFEGGDTKLFQTISGAAGYEFADSIINNRIPVWNFSAHFYNLEGDAYAGHQTLPGDYRSVFIRLSKTAGTITLWLQDNYDRQRNNLPVDFNYNNFELRIDLNEQLYTITVIEYGYDNKPKRPLSYSWRANLFITTLLGTGNFAFGINGTGVVERTDITTHLERPLHIAINGDSILGNRGMYPTQQGITSRMMQGFHDEGKHNLSMANFCQPGAGIVDVNRPLPSILAFQPKILIHLAGANDPIQDGGNFNQAFIDNTKAGILMAQAKGTHFVLCTMTPDNGDPKNLFRDAFYDQFQNDPDISHSLFTMIDTLTPCVIGGGNYNWIPAFSPGGGPHPSPAGAEFIGRKLLFPIIKNIVSNAGW